MPSPFRALLFFIIISAALPCAANAQTDVQGAADHPQVPRYEGSWILGYDTQAFVRFDLPTGPAGRRGGNWAGETSETLEGASTRLLYVAPRERSTLEVFRNYEAALTERGFEILFSCSGRACGNNEAMARNILWTRDRQLASAGDLTRYALTGMHDDHYLAARGADGGTWLALYVARNDFRRFAQTHDHPIVLIDVVETGEMERRMIDAAAMARSIFETGRVALDNIYFDFNAATLRPESGEALAEMARLLTENPDIGVYIVGHTDSIGGYEFNLDLSRRRAQAVVDALVGQHGVAIDRVVPAGVGPLAPLASNATTEGQAQNRRVELVQR
ncbi:DUF4892 domain-containing protein [Pseudogemmobacter sonorensis]|uniref:OmpA family protein n=1 Tax=Pseudogemmobacter sonorensis TaxID=2989681 RepID=UPI0036C2E8A9